MKPGDLFLIPDTTTALVFDEGNQKLIGQSWDSPETYDKIEAGTPLICLRNFSLSKHQVPWIIEEMESRFEPICQPVPCRTTKASLPPSMHVPRPQFHHSPSIGSTCSTDAVEHPSQKSKLMFLFAAFFLAPVVLVIPKTFYPMLPLVFLAWLLYVTFQWKHDEPTKGSSSESIPMDDDEQTLTEGQMVSVGSWLYLNRFGYWGGGFHKTSPRKRLLEEYRDTGRLAGYLFLTPSLKKVWFSAEDVSNAQIGE